MLLPIVIALAATAAGHPTHHLHPFHKRGTYTGIATFNNFAAQGNTNCGPTSGQNGAYGAAASDISPDISGGTCPSSINMSQCAGQSPVAGYPAPSCPKSNCGKCYKVTNNGGVGGIISGVGNSVTVQIIDACPSSSAYNFCKTDMPADQRCGDPGTNQLDIDQSAYMALTGQTFGSSLNLNIGIEDADCSGGTSAGGPASNIAPAPAASSSTAADPFAHSAAGDYLTEHLKGGSNNLEVQPIASAGSSSSSMASPPPSASSSSSAASPPPPATSSSSSAQSSPAATSTSPTAASGIPNGGDDEDCDEL